MDTVHFEVQLFSKAAERAKHVEEIIVNLWSSNLGQNIADFANKAKTEIAGSKTLTGVVFPSYLILGYFGQYLQSLILVWNNSPFSVPCIFNFCILYFIYFYFKIYTIDRENSPLYIHNKQYIFISIIHIVLFILIFANIFQFCLTFSSKIEERTGFV